jgi:hypothetical protein
MVFAKQFRQIVGTRKLENAKQTIDEQDWTQALVSFGFQLLLSQL